MRVKRLVTTTAISALLAVGVAVPSQANLTTFCDGVASDVTVPGDLVVRAGDSCELTNVTISGNAVVRAGANLLLEGSAVEGALRVNADGFASVIETRVDGATRLTQAFGVYSEDSAHELNVVAENSEFYYAIGSSHGRNVTASDVEVFFESSRVSRNLDTDGGLLADVYDSVIEGAVSVTGAELGSAFCFSEVDGDATFSGNNHLLQIGGQSPVSDCGFNVFGGTLTVSGNSADARVAGNVIRGDLVCSDNDPAPVVSGNRVRGDDLCDAAATAGFSAKSGMRSADDLTSHKDDVRAKIDARLADSEEAAEQAGYAFD